MPDMTSNMRSFVKFIRPEKGFPQGVAVVVEVKSRELSKLDIPPLTDFFYFFDASINPQDGHMNQSPVYMVAKKLLTREQAKKLLVPNAAQHGNIGWDKKLREHELFALTRNDNIEVVHDDMIVLDPALKQVFPKLPPKPKAAFSATVGRDVMAPAKAQFKPRRLRSP